MFNNRVVNGSGWEVTRSRMELAAPEGLLHSLLTWCLILIRLYRSEGAAHGREGARALPLCVRWLIMLSWQGGRGEQVGRERGIRGVHKGPLSCVGGTQSGWAMIRRRDDVTCTAPTHVADHRGLHTCKPVNCAWLAVRGKPENQTLFCLLCPSFWMNESAHTDEAIVDRLSIENSLEQHLKCKVYPSQKVNESIHASISN